MDRTVRLVDSHLHLDYDRFDGERDGVVARAVAAGVGAMITIGTDLATSRAAVALAERYGPVWAAVGVHPNEADGWDEGTADALRALAAHPKVVAIGEIGRDNHWDRVAPARQQEVFEAQLALAAELGMPVVIHDREAHDEIMETLRRWVSRLTSQSGPGVLHCFSGDGRMAREALALGFYLGVDGPVTFKNAAALHELVSGLPLNRLLIETDAPFLTPHPRRGKRNEPAYVRYVAEQVAALMGRPVEEVATVTTGNARRLFGFELDE